MFVREIRGRWALESYAKATSSAIGPTIILFVSFPLLCSPRRSKAFNPYDECCYKLRTTNIRTRNKREEDRRGSTRQTK